MSDLEPFKAIFKTLPKKRLCEMWCDLNSWDIPKELKGEILTHNYKNSERGSLAMRDIVAIVGINACLDEWRKRVSEK